MSDVKWIKVYTNMVSNKKIKRIRTLPEGNNIILIWVFLLAQAGECNKDGALYLTDTIPFRAEDLAVEFGFEIPVIKLALVTLEKFSMVEVFEEIIYIKNWSEYQNIEGLDKIRKQTAIRVANHRANKQLLPANNEDVTQCNVTGNANVTQSNELELELELELDKDTSSCPKNKLTINNSNNSNNSNKDIYTATQFKPPTTQEVETYCLERNNDVDVNKWHDFYSSKGWMIGKNKMKDWKAAVRTWEHKDNKGGIKLSGFAKKPTSQIASGEAETDEEWPVSNSSTRGL